MTELGYETFDDYLDHLRSIGRLSFTIDQAMVDLKVSRNSIFSGIRRLKKDGRLISPAQGFYIIIPPETQATRMYPSRRTYPFIHSSFKN